MYDPNRSIRVRALRQLRHLYIIICRRLCVIYGSITSKAPSLLHLQPETTNKQKCHSAIEFDVGITAALIFRPNTSGRCARFGTRDHLHNNIIVYCVSRSGCCVAHARENQHNTAGLPRIRCVQCLCSVRARIAFVRRASGTNWLHHRYTDTHTKCGVTRLCNTHINVNSQTNDSICINIFVCSARAMTIRTCFPSSSARKATLCIYEAA